MKSRRILLIVIGILLLSSASFAQRKKIMLFGGRDHKTYLGCLSCNKTATDSIYNEYGAHGSRYLSSSIWNHYSEFGSGYSNFSACNPYATDPPVIVDADGKYYGRLTLNKYHPELGAGSRFFNLLSSVCGE